MLKLAEGPSPDGAVTPPHFSCLICAVMAQAFEGR